MQLKDTNTEERILEAAKTAFMKYGLYGARMQDIADNAGINKALLHYYFRSKEKLFDQVFEGALARYFEQMLVFSDTTLPIRERIFRYVDSMIDFLSEYPQMSMFIIKEISVNPDMFHEKVVKLKQGSKVRLMDLLREGIASGELPQIDPIMFIMNLHSLCAYPFLAAPIFNKIVTAAETDWSDPGNQKLKQSVKELVAFKLQLQNK